MNLGLIGLGKMGNGIATRLASAGHTVVGFDQNAEAAHALQSETFSSVESLEQLVQNLAQPRTILLSLPAGEVTSSVLHYLENLVISGDTVIDCGIVISAIVKK